MQLTVVVLQLVVCRREGLLHDVLGEVGSQHRAAVGDQLPAIAIDDRVEGRFVAFARQLDQPVVALRSECRTCRRPLEIRCCFHLLRSLSLVRGLIETSSDRRCLSRGNVASEAAFGSNKRPDGGRGGRHRRLSGARPDRIGVADRIAEAALRQHAVVVDRVADAVPAGPLGQLVAAQRLFDALVGVAEVREQQIGQPREEVEADDRLENDPRQHGTVELGHLLAHLRPDRVLLLEHQRRFEHPAALGRREQTLLPAGVVDTVEGIDHSAAARWRPGRRRAW